MNSSPEDFDRWFLETHGGTKNPTWELTDKEISETSDEWELNETIENTGTVGKMETERLKKRKNNWNNWNN